MAQYPPGCNATYLGHAPGPLQAHFNLLTEALCISMGMKKSSQELKRDLNGIAVNLERTASEISRLAEQIKGVDVVAVLHLMNRLYRDADLLKAYTDEIRAGRIVRGKAES